MFKNYIKIAFRNLWKKKGYSALNIFGLALGICFASLIFIWVEDEVSFDDYFANKETLYKVKDHQTYDDVTYSFDATPGFLAEAMLTDLPGINTTARSSVTLKNLFSISDKNLYAKGNYVDPSFLSLFQLKFIKGSAQTSFDQLHSLVLTEGLAVTLFGSLQDIIGKTIQVDNDQEYKVTGVIEDLPSNVSFDFQWLAPFEVYRAENDWLQYWASNGVITYASLKEHANLTKINKQLYDYVGNKQEGAIAKMELYPMTRWRLYDNFENGIEIPGKIKYVKLFSLIAWIILTIACINFMNLSTARSQKRAGEVGVRKVLGAKKGGLIFQFLAESIILALLSAFFAVILLYIALPIFNALVEKQLSVQLFNPIHIGALLSISLGCGLLSGILPAYYLSSFKPVSVLKGLKIKEGSSVWVRKSLVIVQFSISIVLIIGTILIYQQIQHIKNRNLGFDKEHLIYLDVNEQIYNHFEPLKDQILKSGYVSHVALSSNTPLVKGTNTGNFNWKGKDPNKEVLINFEGVTSDYTNTMGMTLQEGRNFYSNIKIDSSSVLINQAFADIIDNPNIIGSTITFHNKTFNVIGVLNDFVFNNIYSKSGPLVFYPNTNGNYLNMRLSEGVSISKALAELKNIFEKMNTGYPFEFKFADEQFENKFKTESLISKLAGVFAALAILISCLGLFGLAAYTAEQRTKEVGVRKVLGASVQNLVGLLSKDFLKLVFISLLISCPLAWWIMKDWLQNYEYRIEIEWWVFVFAGVVALCVAFLTVSFQAIKAAIANPVKSLRTE